METGQNSTPARKKMPPGRRATENSSGSARRTGGHRRLLTRADQAAIEAGPDARVLVISETEGATPCPLRSHHLRTGLIQAASSHP
jgi:hypothetical protein